MGIMVHGIILIIMGNAGFMLSARRRMQGVGL